MSSSSPRGSDNQNPSPSKESSGSESRDTTAAKDTSGSASKSSSKPSTPSKGLGSLSASKTSTPAKAGSYPPPSGDGKTSLTATWDFSVVRDPTVEPQFVIKPISGGLWQRTTYGNARYAAIAGLQVFTGQSYRSFTQWDPSILGTDPNAAFFGQREEVERAEREYIAAGGYVPEEDLGGSYTGKASSSPSGKSSGDGDFGSTS